MAYTPWDTYVDTVPVPTTIEELQQALQLKYNTTWPEIANQITSLGGDPTNFDELAELCGLGSIKSSDGTSTMWYYKDTLDDFTYTPTPSVSTNTYSSRSSVQTPMNTSIDDVTGKVTVSNTPKSGSFTQDATYILSEVGQAATIVSAGTSLGKVFSNALYTFMPDFFPEGDWWAFNPETWGSITNGDDSLGADLFNFVFGIDPQANKAQAYMDADAYAYLAYAMYKKGVFATNTDPAMEDGDLQSTYYPQPIPYSRSFIYDGEYAGTTYLMHVNVPDNMKILVTWRSGTPERYAYQLYITICCDNNVDTFTYETKDSSRPAQTITTNANTAWAFQNKTVYYRTLSVLFQDNHTADYVLSSPVQNIMGNDIPKACWVLIYGNEIPAAIQGIGTQPDATLPDTSTWSDVPSTDTYLRGAYPDLYNDALQYDVLQPDGNVLTKTYIPVPFPQNITSPDTSNNTDPWNNPQPTTDNAKQTSPEIDIATSPDDFIKQLIKTITQTVQITNTDNPTTTGTGETPTLIPIAGTSTALWSVYNPTKAQIDSFGAWLWTDNVIQQFIQLLNNPMEGIITLHKVFATPAISGTGTIVVGRLDSGVSSNLVSQQYVTVDCGSVRLDEYFGNVFDYSPHTTISLYLPFIGFVPLNVDDIMRSTISIIYGVDVFTGACLATVNVDRDGNSVGLYQYSGVASVEYPLTGAQHGGLVNGLLGVAGGVAGIALASTGVGVVAGASAVAGGLANAAKTSNARSGGFSGNAGAMGIKIPYLIIERPITKIANTFDVLNGYPTNYDCRLGDCSGNVIVKYVHIEGINATENELSMIKSMLKNGVVV